METATAKKLIDITEHSEALDACDRLRGQKHFSPRRQYFRLSRAEVEALVALAAAARKQ